MIKSSKNLSVRWAYMAVGVIVGGAFTAIVNSLVNDVITPLLGIIIGGIDFSGIIIQ